MPDTSRPSLATDPDDQSLIAGLGQALQGTLLSSWRRISPRRVKQTAQEIAASFLPFLERQDDETVRSYGRHLALEGVGHSTILAVIETCAASAGTLRPLTYNCYQLPGASSARFYTVT